MNSLVTIHPQVLQALHDKQPVVALESAIISHGMSYPKNVETALNVEDLMRKHGVVPATVAIMNGKCQVGITPEQIEYLGNASGVWKVSLRDLPYVVSKSLLGGTTVSATMRISSWAGIKVFVTGGIGGVHRGAATTMDISADLTEMAQTSVAVVSAGVKSILDIGLTLEYLETMGVPVISYGQDAFPGFYSRNSGFNSPSRSDTPKDIASILYAKWQLGMQGSVLVANPVPSASEVPQAEMEQHIQLAIHAASDKNISGKDLTPFILKYISDHTRGGSLQANIALINNDAMLGALIAKAYAALQ